MSELEEFISIATKYALSIAARAWVLVSSCVPLGTYVMGMESKFQLGFVVFELSAFCAQFLIPRLVAFILRAPLRVPVDGAPVNLPSSILGGVNTTQKSPWSSVGHPPINCDDILLESVQFGFRVGRVFEAAPFLFGRFTSTLVWFVPVQVLCPSLLLVCHLYRFSWTKMGKFVSSSQEIIVVENETEVLSTE